MILKRLKMDWNKNIFILLVINICLISVHCQDPDLFQNYDLVKSIQKSVEDINLSKNLKAASEEDKAFLNGFQDSLPKSIQPMLMEQMKDSASDKCVDDLRYVYTSLLTYEDWAMKMVDSYGKPESGILFGNVRWIGEYNECLKVYAPPKGKTGLGDFHGKYCYVKIPLKLESVNLTISTGVCLPDTCNPNTTFDGMFQKFPADFNITGMNQTVENILSNATIFCKAKSKEKTTGFIVVVSLLSVITLLAVIGSSITVLEHYLKRSDTELLIALDKSSLNGDVERSYNDDALSGNKEIILPVWLEKSKPFFNCFCIFTNGEKILNTASAEGQLPCLHGIRFLSMTWVIVCHGYLAMSPYIRSPLDGIDVIDTFGFQIILNGFFSVDSFFALSGFLVGYVYFKNAPKTDGKIPWLYFYIHRYIRLTPVYMIVLAFYVLVQPYLGSGPLWPEYNVEPICKDNWWWNLLYINDFQKSTNACMGWSWYLSNDMQFYAISPLFLVTLYRWPKIGYSLLGLFFCMSFTANFALTYQYDLIVGFGNIVEYAKDLQSFEPSFEEFTDKIYFRPYTRVGAYLVGLIVAYIVYIWKRDNYGKLKKMTLGIGWILASGITLACQFGLYHNKLSIVEASFYNALSRIAFSMGLGWVIFVCVIGQGDVVNSILSWKVLIPLSRLTYCAYLVHPLVQMTYFASMKSYIVFNNINVVMLFFGCLFISYSAALVTTLVLESPVIRLERLLRNKLSS